jgi:hypothetical protein
VTVELSISKAKQAKKRRAQRARKRQRSHDLRSRYRVGDLPDPGNLDIVSVDDSFAVDAAYLERTGNLNADARLAPVEHADGSVSQGAMAWTPPARAQTAAIRNLRGDTIGRMHARRQVNESQYRAARAFQRLIEQSTGTLHSVDLEKPVIDCAPVRDPLPPFRIAAAKQLRWLEGELKEFYGITGLRLARTVLSDGVSLEASARLFGATSAREIASVAWLFRRSLDCLAKALGLASSTRRPYQPKFVDGEDPALDPGRHAGDAELVDLSLRHGRP